MEEVGYAFNNVGDRILGCSSGIVVCFLSYFLLFIGDYNCQFFFFFFFISKHIFTYRKLLLHWKQLNLKTSMLM